MGYHYVATHCMFVRPCPVCSSADPGCNTARVYAFVKCPGVLVCEVTPILGSALPNFWHLKPMLPMKDCRVTPLR
jgi:hypothetical protein